MSNKNMEETRHQLSCIEELRERLEKKVEETGKRPTFKVVNFGCQMNAKDAEKLAGILSKIGYVEAETEEADFVLYNTCTVRENANLKVYGRLGHLKTLKKKNPDMLIALCGCMMQEADVVEKIKESYRFVDIIFGTHNIFKLAELLKARLDSGEMIIDIWKDTTEIVEDLPAERKFSFKCGVNIMYGCNNFCTYCIVPYTRGKQRSRTMDQILFEVKELYDQGYKEITLLGQNVNAYGKDIDPNMNFACLLEEVAKIGIPRIRFTTSHPWDFSDDMIDVIAKYDNIMPFVHLPLQSGDDEILKRMGRRYTSESYMELFNKIVTKIDRVAVSTDVIVGFPNESDEQFEHTLEIMEKCKFDNAFTFIFSPRPGTPAARMEDPIDFETKKERLARLNTLWNKYALEKNKAYEGKVVKVLVDGFSKKDDHVYSGYTDTNKLVNFTGENIQPGDFVDVLIETGKTFFLLRENTNTCYKEFKRGER